MITQQQANQNLLKTFDDSEMADTTIVCQKY